MLFGKRSEKREPMPDHPWLFPEPAKKPATEEKSVDIAAHTRKTKKRFAEEKEAPEGTFPDHFPRREQVIDEKPEGVADEDLELVSEKVTERLEVVPEQYYVLRIVRKVYKNKTTGKFHTPEAPDHVLGRRCKVSEMCEC